MRRPLTIAVLSAGFFVPSLLGAPHGPAPRSMGAGASGVVRMARSAPAIRLMPTQGRRGPVRSSPVRGRSFGFGSSSPSPGIAPGYFIGTPCFTVPSYSGSFFCSQFLSHHRSHLGLETGFVPYYSYYQPTSVPDEEPPAAVVEQDNSLVRQVERLSDEVEMLREDQTTRDDLRPSSVAPQKVAEEKSASTVFVYRDGHQVETQNYAILGKTLWVFAGETTRKIPLADLNIDATRKLNDERGIDFTSPDSR